MKTYNFYADPAHGWLRVPLGDLISSGFHLGVSPYSYIKGDWAYLEEDRDATLFLGIVGEVSIKESHTNNQSRIRSYQPFPSHQDWKRWRLSEKEKV